MSGQALRQQMLRRLDRKYEIALNFYRGKEINQILSLDPRYRVYLEYCDARCIAEDFEYLKRIYCFKSPSGKPEITQRMKMISQHYATNPALSTFTYEYPMMVVTNTKSLFLRRKRRLRKIGAGQGSSDDTEQQQDEYPAFQYPTEYFLEDLDESSFTEREELDSQVSYESSPYDVYADADIPIRDQIPIFSLDSDQAALQRLIDDFSSANRPEREREFSATYLPKGTLASIQNQAKRKRESLQVRPIEDTLKINKKQKRSDVFSNYVQMVLSKPISFSDLGLGHNAAVEDYNHLPIVSQPPSIQLEREERASRRKKIREKAEELLKRVRNDQEAGRPQ